MELKKSAGHISLAEFRQALALPCPSGAPPGPLLQVHVLLTEVSCSFTDGCDFTHRVGTSVMLLIYWCGHIKSLLAELTEALI